jgi:hypothetical protein
MRKMKGFDLIVTGDNHEQFGAFKQHRIFDTVPPDEFPICQKEIEAAGGIKECQLLVNPGSMMRTSAKQIDHEPAVFLWYADTNTVVRVPFPIDPAAVSREHIERTEQHDERMEAFVESIEGRVDMDLTFEDNVRRRCKEAKVGQPVRDIVEEVIG